MFGSAWCKTSGPLWHTRPTQSLPKPTYFCVGTGTVRTHDRSTGTVSPLRPHPQINPRMVSEPAAGCGPATLAPGQSDGPGERGGAAGKHGGPTRRRDEGGLELKPPQRTTGQVTYRFLFGERAEQEGENLLGERQGFRMPTVTGGRCQVLNYHFNCQRIFG